MVDLLSAVLHAHGGLDKWRQFSRVQATIVTGGGLWAIKGQPQDPLPRRMTVALDHEWASGQTTPWDPLRSGTGEATGGARGPRGMRAGSLTPTRQLPRRAILAPGPTNRKEESSPGGRALDPRDRLAPAAQPDQLHRPRRRQLVRATDNTHRRDRLGQLVAEGTLTRNVALLVDRVPGKAKKFETFTADQVRVVLDGVADDRNRHAWHMALAEMRRGEIAGQRWDDVDLENKVIRIGPTRVDVRGRALDQDDPKTVAAERPLPIPDRLLAELKAARARQATEKLALGRAYNDQGYVVCNEAGEPHHPSTITKLWADAIRGLDVPQIRLHDARHTCATLMHLQNVPIALVAAWLGHADLSFTMRTYVHAQPEALQQAADSFAICPSKAIE